MAGCLGSVIFQRNICFGSKHAERVVELLQNKADFFSVLLIFGDDEL